MAQAKDFLQLEFHGGLDLVDLVLDKLVLTNGDGELIDLVEGVSEESGDLLHQDFRGHQLVVLLGPLLDWLPLLVELLQPVDVDVVNSGVLGLFAVNGVSDDADLG